MSTNNHSSTSKGATITLAIIGAIIIIGIIISKVNLSSSQIIQLKNDKTILEMDPLKGKYVGVNKNQIIKITNDGVSAYNLDGQEIWSDTLTLESIWVQQREPYFVVSSKGSRKLAIFNEKGQQGEITTQGPIAYFSINEKGQLAVIEEMEDGHKVSAYTNSGEFIGSRISYISSGIFPITAEVSPDSKLLLISYLGVREAKVTSRIEAVLLEKTENEQRDNVLYGIEEQDNLIYEIEFINDDEWVAIGDKNITIYKSSSEKVKSIPGLYVTYTPYLNKRSSMSTYLPILATETLNGNTLHAKESLHLFNKLGEETSVIPFESPITYFYADDKGVIVGEGKQYKGYNKLGNQYFEYQASQDISKLIYLDNEAVAITKDKVMLLKPKRNQ
ncbi:MAG: DUF5711 family protein [Clostridium sp.]